MAEVVAEKVGFAGDSLGEGDGEESVDSPFTATTSATATPSSDPSFNSASCYSSQFFYGGGSFG